MTSIRHGSAYTPHTNLPLEDAALSTTWLEAVSGDETATITKFGALFPCEGWYPLSLSMCCSSDQIDVCRYISPILEECRAGFSRLVWTLADLIFAPDLLHCTSIRTDNPRLYLFRSGSPAESQRHGSWERAWGNTFGVIASAVMYRSKNQEEQFSKGFRAEASR